MTVPTFAAIAMVASWVLSPISARKKRISVAVKTPYFFQRLCPASLSSLSGIIIQMPMPMKDTISTQRRISGVSHALIQ